MKRGRNGASVARGRACSGGAHGAEDCMTIDDLGDLWFRSFRDELSLDEDYG
jgi:hypothetical protein